jgi:hypothetical protein
LARYPVFPNRSEHGLHFADFGVSARSAEHGMMLESIVSQTSLCASSPGHFRRPWPTVRLPTPAVIVAN